MFSFCTLSLKLNCKCSTFTHCTKKYSLCILFYCCCCFVSHCIDCWCSSENPQKQGAENEREDVALMLSTHRGCSSRHLKAVKEKRSLKTLHKTIPPRRTGTHQQHCHKETSQRPHETSEVSIAMALCVCVCISLLMLRCISATSSLCSSIIGNECCKDFRKAVQQKRNS